MATEEERERERATRGRICNIFIRCVRKDYPTTNEQTGCVTLPNPTYPSPPPTFQRCSEFLSSFAISRSPPPLPPSLTPLCLC